MLRILSLFSTILLFSLPVTATQLHKLQDLLPPGVQVSYIVAASKQQQNTQVLMLPASTQKLITALAAKLYLPNDFTFKTQINGITAHHSLSNAEFVFNADPTFSRSDLRIMLNKLKQRGIQKIKGDIKLNISRFNGYNWSNGQVWNDQAVCYATQSSALIINGNCVLGNLKRSSKQSNKKPNIAKVFIPEYQPLTITSSVKIVSKEQKKAQFCDLEVNRKTNNNYQLFGCITPSTRPLPLSFAITEPTLYFADILRQELDQLNIIFTGDITVSNQHASSPILVSHDSAPLDVLLRTMLKKSDNLIADVMFKTLGAEYYHQAGNYRNGASAVKAILQNKGIDISQAYIADGSGLSRHNLLSAQMLFDTLNYLIKHDKKLQLIDMMPISGQDGTLKYRRGLLGKGLKRKIQAKTGSLKGATNMVGVVTTKSDQRIPFVLMINGYNAKKHEVPKQPTALTQYLFEFFTNIVNQDKL